MVVCIGIFSVSIQVFHCFSSALESDFSRIAFNPTCAAADVAAAAESSGNSRRLRGKERGRGRGRGRWGQVCVVVGSPGQQEGGREAVGLKKQEQELNPYLQSGKF